MPGRTPGQLRGAGALGPSWAAVGPMVTRLGRIRPAMLELNKIRRAFSHVYPVWAKFGPMSTEVPPT